MTGYTDINPVLNGNGLKLNIVRKGSDKWTEIDYRVTYEDPEPVGDNVRIFRAANTSTARPRIVLRKQNWEGEWLSGAVFTLSLEGDEANAITYTSDANGLITIAYPEPSKTYVLTEVKSPAGYRGLSVPLEFRVDVTVNEAGEITDETVTVSPDTDDITPYYRVDTEGEEEKKPDPKPDKPKQPVSPSETSADYPVSPEPPQTVKPTDIPDTGNRPNPVVPLTVLLVFSAVGCIFLTGRSKKRNQP